MKALQYFAVAVVLLSAGLFPAKGAPLTARVIADRVNLRSKASPTAEVVAQVSSNDLLTVRSWGEEWIEIAPPAHADLWIHKEFIKDSEVLAQNVNIRAGPSVNYAVVGKVSPGMMLERRGEFGDWIKIAPPDSASLWIATSLVQIQRPPETNLEVSAAAQPVQEEAPEASATLEKQPAAAPEPQFPAQAETVTVALNVSEPTPEPVLTAGAASVVITTMVVSVSEAQANQAPVDPALPSGFSLLPVAGQGTRLVREGKLHLIGYAFRSPSRYRLANSEGDTICYMNGNQNQLRSLLGRRMRVTGREYWVKGKDYPVLTVERIVLLTGH